METEPTAQRMIVLPADNVGHVGPDTAPDSGMREMGKRRLSWIEGKKGREIKVEMSQRKKCKRTLRTLTARLTTGTYR